MPRDPRFNADESSVASAEVDNAIVLLAKDAPLRRFFFGLIDFIDIWVGGVGGQSGRLQIIVRDKRNGDVVWVNHGYTPSANPEEAFESICEEIRYFTLEGFLRRHSKGYLRRH